MLDRGDTINHELLEAVIAGLTATPKTISPKWLYDEVGSALFEAITRLEEYYPTRVETGILGSRAAEIASLFSDAEVMLELGSGASVKTRILLDNMRGLSGYAPLDISAQFLAEIGASLQKTYPALDITPIVADFTRDFELPESLAAAPKLLFFPGSTIGNLDRAEARALLHRLSALPAVEGLVLGADLVKPVPFLTRAYDDPAGVTAAFNKNMLARFNRECGAGFDLAGFRHEARWNVEHRRIEMHLVSQRRQSVRIGNHLIEFADGETIHTENSHKFTRAAIAELAAQSGWRLDRFWTDDDSLFSLSVLRLA